MNFDWKARDWDLGHTDAATRIFDQGDIRESPYRFRSATPCHSIPSLRKVRQSGFRELFYGGLVPAQWDFAGHGPNDREPRGQGCPQVLLQRCAMIELVSIILSFGNATDDA